MIDISINNCNLPVWPKCFQNRPSLVCTPRQSGGDGSDDDTDDGGDDGDDDDDDGGHDANDELMMMSKEVGLTSLVLGWKCSTLPSSSLCRRHCRLHITWAILTASSSSPSSSPWSPSSSPSSSSSPLSSYCNVDDCSDCAASTAPWASTLKIARWCSVRPGLFFFCYFLFSLF